MSLVDESCYAPYENLAEFKNGLLLVESNPELYTKVEVYKGMYSITPFGDAFKSICI